MISCAFYEDIMTRHIEEKEISIEHYSGREKLPYPSLLSDILLERYTISSSHSKLAADEFKKDKYPFKTAKSSMKPCVFIFMNANAENCRSCLNRGI